MTDKIYVRPIAKRVAVDSSPLILKMTKPATDSERLEYAGLYEPELDPDEQDVLTLFREIPGDRTIKDIYEDIGHQASELETRKALKNLENKGLLVMSRRSHNLFKYRLP